MQGDIPMDDQKYDQRPCLAACQHYFTDYPYSFFSIRRRPPNMPKHEKRKLKCKAGLDEGIDTKELHHSFDYRFWDFDIALIDKAQFFHVMRQQKCKKAVGYVLAGLSQLVSCTIILVPVICNSGLCNRTLGNCGSGSNIKPIRHFSRSYILITP